ncbi:hypothetical protein [Trichlorobacter lovleyi]|uniref:Uncharacterized protein n=1 Tax=Trichlorobacter lovleyi (strain ATCC BAA-1151 / DSM 17278 / SZ) TaxID=398767 RepID=B3E7B6_TRIL1|nr:hypothetical protein [Trichlorobacter lovleyi]ACD96433.1 hypothetical protein Glov_2720 [Trichlorobacter lovleyi SZ]
MALTKEEKDWCFSTAVNLAFKMAEGGGAEKGVEIANCIEYSYQILTKLTEEVKN